MSPHKAAIKELCTAAAASAKRLSGAVKAAATPAKVKTGGKGKGKSKGGSEMPVVTLWELAPNFGTPLAVTNLAEWTPETADFQIPTLIRMPQTDGLLTDDAPKSELERFQAKFKNSEVRNQDGRAQRAAQPSFATTLTTRFAEIIPNDKTASAAAFADSGAVESALKPAVFGIAKGQETTTSEVGHLTCLRFVTHGTRSVTVARTSDLLDFAMSRGETKASITPKRLYQMFKSLNGEMLKKWVNDDKLKLYHGTLSPGDVFLLPCGWTFAERVMGNQDVYGFRVAYVLPSDRDLYAQLNQWLLTCKKPCEVMQKALDKLIVGS